MASLLLGSSSSLVLPTPSNQTRKSGVTLTSVYASFTQSCQRTSKVWRNHNFKFQMGVKASSGIDLLAEESTIAPGEKDDMGVVGIHHVGLLCQNLEKSLEFYKNLLGLEINEARPHHKLPYRGAWLWVGPEMIHLMELPNPDPLTGRPEHGGRDRHACIAIRDVSKLKTIFDRAGIKYTLSKSGRPAIFARDPDGNALEFTQVD